MIHTSTLPSGILNGLVAFFAQLTCVPNTLCYMQHL